MKGVNIAIKIAKRKKRLFENYEKIGREMKKVLEKILGEVRVIIFGSVVKGDYTPLSDLDILIVTEKNVNYGELIEKIEEELGDLTGVEIHLVTPEVFERWYKKFLNAYVEVP